MKFPTAIYTGIGLFGFCVALAAVEPTRQSPPASAAQPKAGDAHPTVSDLQLIEAWGWVITQDFDAARFGFNADAIAAFNKGLTDGIKGGPPPQDPHDAMPYVDQFVDAQTVKALAPETAQNQALATTFLADLKKKSGIIVLPNGVCCEIIKPGDGPKPKELQTVRLRYVGRLLNGTEFANFMGNVVLVPKLFKQGLFEGLQQINAGGTIKLYVPPALAEPEAYKVGIPRGSVMTYEVQLFKIKETTPEDRESALLPPPPEVVLPPSPFSDLQLIEEWGWSLSRRTWACNFEYGDAEIAALLKGITHGLKGETPSFDPNEMHPLVMQYVADSRKKVQDHREFGGLAETKAFFEKLKENPKVVKLPSGLCYEILKPGNGPFPTKKSRLWVNYSGRLINGKVFDSSDPTIGPLSVDLDKVTAGWTEGAQKINAGGTIKLYIPPALGYGSSSNGMVLPNSTLIYEIELLRFEHIPTEDLAIPEPPPPGNT